MDIFLIILQVKPQRFSQYINSWDNNPLVLYGTGEACGTGIAGICNY